MSCPLVAAHPDPRLTPGMVVSTDASTACAWGRTRRFAGSLEGRVEAEKRVFAIYGIPYADHRKYELDHFYPRCLGGADADENLWPQPCTRWERYACEEGPAADKDADEAYVCRQICRDHIMTVEDGKRYIEERWR